MQRKKSMGTTFVSIDSENGFWMKDGILELWLRFLSLHLEDPSNEEEERIINPIRNQWLLASRGYFSGCVPLSLKEDVSTEEGRRLVLEAIHSALDALKKAPKELNKDVLNLLGISGEFVRDFETSRLIEVGDSFIALIEGRIKTKVNDTSFMPGCKNERK
ncbi:hypothetical protein IEN85_10180 [Pelagicoccus sp. NFK12]|uniref:Uncharacterized protein n=1 Tax=Pelagicoccus enzymogenes TaxID=2773457 RepID=A0A927F9T3_9BACT|nr:hypothetical protein [Pelagicoccus enzymogenes]MBD5779856.1 hypothetical protein [Pelagicoccus enzymogenes]